MISCDSGQDSVGPISVLTTKWGTESVLFQHVPSWKIANGVKLTGYNKETGPIATHCNMLLQTIQPGQFNSINRPVSFNL